MSVHLYVEKEKSSILDFLNNNLIIPQGLNKTDYLEYTSKKIEEYVQSILEEIKKHAKAEPSKDSFPFSIEKKSIAIKV